MTSPEKAKHLQSVNADYLGWLNELRFPIATQCFVGFVLIRFTNDSNCSRLSVWQQDYSKLWTNVQKDLAEVLLNV